MLTAAVQAPNHHLAGPWRFVVLTWDSRRDLCEVMVRAKISKINEIENVRATAAAAQNFLLIANAMSLRTKW